MSKNRFQGFLLLSQNGKLRSHLFMIIMYPCNDYCHHNGFGIMYYIILCPMEVIIYLLSVWQCEMMKFCVKIQIMLWVGGGGVLV